MDEMAMFVDEVFQYDPDNTYIDIAEAKEVLDQMWTPEVPLGMTPEIFRDRWNWNSLSMYPRVRTYRDGYIRSVPRFHFMTDWEIADLILDSPTWGDVEDLVEYIIDEYNIDWDEEVSYVETLKEEILKWCYRVMKEAGKC